MMRCYPRWLFPMLLILVSAPRLTAQVKTHTLSEMTRLAGSIFIGNVSDVRSGTDEHDEIVTYTTFTIERPIYHTTGSTVTVKQFGGEAEGLSTWLADMRYFQPGERVLVMFYPVSDLGFTSPVGLHQAVWMVTPDGMVHGVNNSALQGFDGIENRYGLGLPPSGSVPVDTFISVINNLLREEGKQ